MPYTIRLQFRSSGRQTLQNEFNSCLNAKQRTESTSRFNYKGPPLADLSIPKVPGKFHDVPLVGRVP